MVKKSILFNTAIALDNENQKATVTVPSDQLSLAIGKGGQNVRLAAKLTGYKIDIIGESGESVVSASDKESQELEILQLSTRVTSSLEKANINTILDLRNKLFSPDGIEGIGPKSKKEIEQALEKLDQAGNVQKPKTTQSAETKLKSETKNTDPSEKTES